MRLFLTILEGPSPSEAEPILATEDRRLIQLVAAWITQRLDPKLGQQDSASQPDAQPEDADSTNGLKLDSRLGGIRLRYFRPLENEPPCVGPVIVCDVCGKDIENAGLGAVVYRKPPYEFDEDLEPFFTHKRACHRQLETRFGSNLVPWAELTEFLRQLDHNTGLGYQKLMSSEAAQ